MDNMQDFITNNPFVKKIQVDGLLFAEFKCPSDGTPAGIWWHDNFFAHILTGELLVKTPRGEYLLKAGDSAFAKKGSAIGQTYVHEDFCELLVFMPDDFIKTVIKKYSLPQTTAASHQPADTLVNLGNDVVLTTYFQSLFTYFHESVSPSGALLKLKFEELLLNIFCNNNYQPLKNYFAEISQLAKTSIKEIMEANFSSNLSLEEFARLCTRSLSTFKKEFSGLYNTTPGKWLLKKRLEYSRFLLETTGHSVDEISFESGFENRSHFNRVFKNKYGCSPGRFRMQKRGLEITSA
jgi:AraC family transcriptional regulator, exoenzyme S synthesis regulatory protein ExsA